MLSFIDSNCFIGRQNSPNLDSFYTLETMKKEMKKINIRKSFVYNNLSKECNPVNGNSQLSKIIAGDEEFMPVWILLPHHTNEFPKPNEVRNQLFSNNVKMVRMFPKEHNYVLEDFVIKPLFNMLMEEGIPLTLNWDETTPDEIYRICNEYKDLKLIISNLNYAVDRNLIPLLEATTSLYVETFAYRVHRGIENLCNKFGAERLVFGSGLPNYCGGASVALINYSAISNEEKELISSRNILRLIGEG
jgi:predicted TIM-barrel fold metal-dependent hydrolase